MSDKKMSLEQVSTALRSLDLNLMSDAIDAEIKSRGAPVAECPDGRFSSVVTWLKPLPPKGTKLYTAPSAPKIDDAMVKRFINAFSKVPAPGDGEEMIVRTALEAALKETP
jgi:hypothetical protein